MKDLIFPALMVFVLWVFADYEYRANTPVELEELKTLQESTINSKAAQEMLKESLGKTPVPSITQFAEIKKSINQVLVLEEAKVITQDTELKQDLSPVSADADKIDTSASKSDGAQWSNIKVILMVFMILFPIAIFYKVYFANERG